MDRTSPLYVALIALVFGLGLGAPARADETCTLEVGDFDSEESPICSGSCRWTDIAPEKVVEVLAQPGQWHRTFRSLLDGRVLEDGRLVQVFKAKPFARRQVTVELAMIEEGDAWRVSWRKARRQEPVEAGLVEIQRFDGWWEVRSDGEGGSVVTHGARFHPGGDIPRAVVRKGMPQQIRRLLRQLRRAVAKG